MQFDFDDGAVVYRVIWFWQVNRFLWDGWSVSWDAFRWRKPSTWLPGLGSMLCPIASKRRVVV